MKVLLVAVLALASAACLTRPAADVEEEKREDEQGRREFVRKENRQREADETAAIRANRDRVIASGVAAREQSKADKIEAERLACETGRPERVAERDRFQKAIERKHELQDWENTHCKWVERKGAPSLHLTQDSTGEYHLREANGNAVDRKCDAPLPKDLEHIEAGSIFVRQPTFAMGCEKWDAQAQK